MKLEQKIQDRMNAGQLDPFIRDFITYAEGFIAHAGKSVANRFTSSFKAKLIRFVSPETGEPSEACLIKNTRSRARVIVPYARIEGRIQAYGARMPLKEHGSIHVPTYPKGYKYVNLHDLREAGFRKFPSWRVEVEECEGLKLCGELICFLMDQTVYDVMRDFPELDTRRELTPLDICYVANRDTFSMDHRAAYVVEVVDCQELDASNWLIEWKTPNSAKVLSPQIAIPKSLLRYGNVKPGYYLVFDTAFNGQNQLTELTSPLVGRIAQAEIVSRGELEAYFTFPKDQV